MLHRPPEELAVFKGLRKDIGFGILSIFHYARRVRVVTCETRAEAERVLKL